METERSDAYVRFDELARRTTEGAAGLMERLVEYDGGSDRSSRRG